MASGNCVIVYEGKRGRVFFIKFRDAAGVQVKERLGREADGWTRKKAERALGARLADVEREAYTKPKRETFSDLVERFRTEYLPGRNLKPNTIQTYASAIDGHLKPFFGSFKLGELEARPELVDRYIAAKTEAGLSPKTIINHLRLLHSVFKRAIRWRLMRTNPVEGVEPPRYEEPEMSVLSEAEIARLIVSFRQLEDDAADKIEAAWWGIARRIVVFAIATGMRRGELLGLGWEHVDLLNRQVRVARTWVRAKFDTPKSKKSRRTLDLGPRALQILEEHWRESAYRSDSDVVFCHPTTGHPLDPSKLSREYIRPALKHAGIKKPFRPFHDLRHTSLTHEAASGNPHAYVQMKAGHSQFSITEKYIHAAQVMFPGAAEKGEARMFRDTDLEDES